MAGQRLRLEGFLPYLLSVTSNMVSDRIARLYRSRFGLKVPEWRLVAVLGERGSATQRELVDATRMDKVTVNRATKALVERGLIMRAPNSADARSHHLALTGEGSSLYAEIVPAALAAERLMLEGLSAAEVEALEHTLAQLRARAES